MIQKCEKWHGLGVNELSMALRYPMTGIRLWCVCNEQTNLLLSSHKMWMACIKHRESTKTKCGNCTAPSHMRVVGIVMIAALWVITSNVFAMVKKTLIVLNAKEL